MAISLPSALRSAPVNFVGHALVSLHVIVGFPPSSINLIVTAVRVNPLAGKPRAQSPGDRADQTERQHEGSVQKSHRQRAEKRKEAHGEAEQPAPQSATANVASGETASNRPTSSAGTSPTS
jgi:hypothetical protein